MVITGCSDRTKFKHQVLNPLIEAGFIEMTVPDKPRSSKQRYRTTPAGRAFIENAEKETQP
jgi:predicted transcriptional regulator